jgi:hypothetical protein
MESPDLKYRKFDEGIHRANMAILFPDRPSIEMTESIFKSKEHGNPIEGM